MIKNKIKYNTGFSTGALLLKESFPVILNIKEAQAFMKGFEDIDPSVIPVNSEASKKRLAREVRRRIQSLENPIFIEYFVSGNNQDKKLILFYALCKTYQLIIDFLLDTVLDKWYNMDFEVTSYDFQLYVYKKIEQHPELEKLSEKQIKKLSSISILALKELGMLQNKKLQKLEFNSQILNSIERNGDSWFLEVLLMNESERQEIIHQ